VRDKVVEFLEDNKLIRNSQHGFRKGSSCLMNLLLFLDKVIHSIDEGHGVDIVYLGLAKTFDKVPHQRLLKKLRKHGIGGKLLSVIENWLKGRRQRVCIRGRWSSWITVWSGVPQGSVLGPLLFLIFINDLDEGIRSHILKFADDTKVFQELRDAAECNSLQSDLDKVVTWAEKQQMDFNVKKCKVMHVGKQKDGCSYYMGGMKLLEEEVEKDLGVWISSDMKCSQQCMYAFNKASRVMGMIKRTIRFKEVRIMLSLYNTLVRPHVEYCASAWSPYYKKDKELFEKVQRRFTKMTVNMDEERLQSLNLWSLEESRNRQDLIEVFKMSKGMTRIRLQELFTLEENNKGTRGHSFKLSKLRCTCDCWKHFFLNRIINRWNGLDQQTVGTTSLNVFKTRLEMIKNTRMGFFMD